MLFKILVVLLWQEISFGSGNPCDKINIHNFDYYIDHKNRNLIDSLLAADTTSYPYILRLNTFDRRTLTKKVSPDNFHLLTDGMAGRIHTQVCFDPNGKCLTVRLVHSDIPLVDDELSSFLCQLLQCHTESVFNADPIECYLLSFEVSKK
ncbi:MAG: hypothetical protein IPN89_10415 [Saprospiraceae bacterium]|nr:hypothetical protein [Saprospiraceae bacterium]